MSAEASLAGRVALGAFRGLTGLFLAVALVAPYVGGSLAAYVTIVLSLALALWQYARRRPAWRDPGAAMLLAAFCLIALAFAVTNRPGQLDVLLAFNFALFALYAPLSGSLQRLARPGNTAIVAWLALAGAVLAAVVATVQVGVYHFVRAEGWGSNPIPSATAALFLGFFALLGFERLAGWRRYVFFLGPIAGIVTVLLSGSRGPLIAIPALLLVAFLTLPFRRIAILATLAVILVGGVAFYTVVKPDSLVRITTIEQVVTDLFKGETEGADKSTITRFKIYKGSLAAFQQSPWIGYGWAQKTIVVGPLADIKFGNPARAHLHSDILNMAVSAGIVGLVAYVLALLAPIVGAVRSPHDSQRRGRLFAALTLSTGYLFCGAINLLFGFEFMTTFYIACAAIFIGYCRDRPAGGEATA